MDKTAILVDGGFYRKRARYLWGERTAEERARELSSYCKAHLRRKSDKGQNYEPNSLYRVFYYDCEPAGRRSVYHWHRSGGTAHEPSRAPLRSGENPHTSDKAQTRPHRQTHPKTAPPPAGKTHPWPGNRPRACTPAHRNTTGCKTRRTPDKTGSGHRAAGARHGSADRGAATRNKKPTAHRRAETRARACIFETTAASSALLCVGQYNTPRHLCAGIWPCFTS